MSHKVELNLKETLLNQLVFLEENATEIIDSYFSSNRNKYKEFLNTYSIEVQDFLSTIDERLEFPPTKAFIGTKVVLKYEDEDETDDYTICMPENSDPDKGFISFLSPVGSQLLLRSSGEIMNLITPGGEFKVTIKAINFDPIQS
jgi:transcription elongation factor GreA